MNKEVIHTILMDNNRNKEIIHSVLMDSQKNEHMIHEHVQRLCEEYEERNRLLEETIFELRNHVEILERDNFLLMKDKVNTAVTNITTNVSKKKRPNKSHVQKT